MKNLEFLTKAIDSVNIEPFTSYLDREEKRKSLNGNWKFVYLKNMDDKYLDASLLGAYILINFISFLNFYPFIII